GTGDAPLLPPATEAIPLAFPLEGRPHPGFERPLQVSAREARLLNDPPWVRSLGKLTLEVSTQGGRFPTPAEPPAPRQPRLLRPDPEHPPEPPLPEPALLSARAARTRLRPPGDTVVFKDRLLYLLQPPLEDLFAGKQVQLPFQPYPYQLQGI